MAKLETYTVEIAAQRSYQVAASSFSEAAKHGLELHAMGGFPNGKVLGSRRNEENRDRECLGCCKLCGCYLFEGDQCFHDDGLKCHSCEERAAA